MFGDIGNIMFGDIGNINLSEDKELNVFLLTNSKPNDHDKIINRLILSSSETILCSGWLKLEGINMVLPSIICAAKKGADITLFSNKGETGAACSCDARWEFKRPKESVKDWLNRREEYCSCTGVAKKVIGKLEQTSKQHPNFKYVIIENLNKHMHQKLYYFKKNDEFIAIIGSGNITEGGLDTNEELSIGLSGVVGSYSHKEIVKYLDKMNDKLHSNDGVELDGWKFIDRIAAGGLFN